MLDKIRSFGYKIIAVFFNSKESHDNLDGGGSDSHEKELKTWKQESYESALMQRNIFIFLTVVSLLAVLLSILAIRYIKNEETIEPFVIEIEKRTGIPTLVDQLTVKQYSSNEAIKRYFVMAYIKAREEYLAPMYQYNFNKVVRVFSSPSVYYSYKNGYTPSNPQGPFGDFDYNATRTVTWKSIIFPAANVAQVRLKVSVQNGQVSSDTDKVVLLSFSFRNLQMNDDERLINPLGFTVDMYRIEDENTGD